MSTRRNDAASALLTMAAVAVVTVAGNYPTFENAAEFRDIMVPAGAPIGSLIYRLRASDHDKDYPLYFQATDFGSYVIRIENLPCPPNTTAGCQADVYLERLLIPGQTFQFRITVRDTRGDTTTVPVRLVSTEARSDVETIFPHIPAIIIVPEDVKVNAELEYVIVKKNTESRKSATIELRGSSELTIGRLRMNKDTTTGTISVSRPLDFETRNMYRLQVVALDMYVEIGKDSRNAAAFEVIVVVEDVQDTPPMFTRLETIVHLHNNVSIGDIITKVEAIDGDRGRPRRIKYGLVSENRPFTVLFEIGLFTGEVKLKRPMSELVKITGGKQPAILTVMADEEVTGTGEPPAMSTLAEIMLILDNAVESPPYFHNSNYNCRLNENSGQGTTLVFGEGYAMQLHDGNTDKESLYAITLENNNGTFEVMPAVIDRRGRFTIMVRDNRLLDFESRSSVNFELVATDLSVAQGSDGGDSNRTRWSVGRSPVIVYLDDVNDNAPRFKNVAYTARMAENATSGDRVITVEASDLDAGLFGSVRYTAVLGFRNASLVLDSRTGVITISNDNHGFDREESAEYRLTVEARDMDGSGLATTVPLIIHVLDINDETPIFQDTPIQFILTQDMHNFTERAFIKAIDKDAEAPNNVVRYEIINGNYNNRFILNPETGELFISNGLYDSSRPRRDSASSAFVVLTVRAYDLGVPHRWSTTQVRIYPPSSGARQMSFMVPASMEIAAMHNLLERLTGGRVTINTIKPYYNHFQQESNIEKNIVTTTVVYNADTVIDIDEFRKNTDQCRENHMTQVDYYKDKNLSYWLNLLLLLAILLAVLSLLFCCCYQQYLRFMYNKFHRVERVENKGIQATTKNSSQSSEDDPKHKIYILSEKPVTPLRIAKRAMTVVIPNAIKKNTSVESLLLEDVEGNEYRILDKRRSWSDETTDNIRQEMFFKQGNAEILRIMSNDSLEVMDSASNVGAFNVFDELAGKKAIMNKFLNSQPGEIVEDQYNESTKTSAGKTQVEETKKDDIKEEEKTTTTAYQIDVLLTKFLAEEQQKLMTRLETKSLPGANMSTQTETHAGTQTTSSCLRASGRRSRSYEDRGEFSRSAHHPRRSTSMPRRQLFNSPIMEETGSGSGTSHSGLRSCANASVASSLTVSGRRPFASNATAASSSSGGVARGDQRKSRSYSSLRELDLDRQLQYMTPSLRSRALARRRLSTSLPPHYGSGGRAPRSRTMQMLEKKSVFTIAYGDVATQKINCSTDSSNNNNWD